MHCVYIFEIVASIITAQSHVNLSGSFHLKPNYLRHMCPIKSHDLKFIVPHMAIASALPACGVSLVLQ